MKFFLPAHDDPEATEVAYAAIRRFVEEHYGALSERRYRRISFTRRGKVATATVGDIEPLVNETVIAIFRQAGGSLYFICTPSRGVLEGGPLLEGDVSFSEEFE